MKEFVEAVLLALCAVAFLTGSILGIVEIVPEENNCNHDNLVWKANTSEHWMECSNCGEEIFSSRSPHLLSYGHCDCESYAEFVGE